MRNRENNHRMPGLHRREVVATLLATCAVSAVPSGLTAQTGDDLSRYRWQRRLLLVFAPVPQDPRLAAQRLRTAEALSGFRDRELTVIEIVERRVLIDGARVRWLDSFAMRSLFEVEDNGFETVLIGKDGGVKLRREGLMPTDVLFDTIDAMPMRRQEMKTD